MLRLFGWGISILFPDRWRKGDGEISPGAAKDNMRMFRIFCPPQFWWINKELKYQPGSPEDKTIPGWLFFQMMYGWVHLHTAYIVIPLKGWSGRWRMCEHTSSGYWWAYQLKLNLPVEIPGSNVHGCQHKHDIADDVKMHFHFSAE